MSLRTVFPLVLLLAPFAVSAARAASSAPYDGAAQEAVRLLVERHGEARKERIERGVRQVAERWRVEDGDSDALRAFVTDRFVVDPDVFRDPRGYFFELMSTSSPNISSASPGQTLSGRSAINSSVPRRRGSARSWTWARWWNIRSGS